MDTLGNMSASELQVYLNRLPENVRAVFATLQTATVPRSQHTTTPSRDLAPSANPYAQQQPQPIFDPYAEAERQREVEKAAAERLREAEAIRRRAEFIQLRDEMRSVAFDQYGTCLLYTSPSPRDS